MPKHKLKVAVDFNSTLAFCDEDHKNIDDQESIPTIKRKCEGWIEQGFDVYLFTGEADTPENIAKLRAWLDKEGLQKIKTITDRKLPKTIYYVDDSALRVEPNTGIMEYDPITKDVDSEIKSAIAKGRY